MIETEKTSKSPFAIIKKRKSFVFFLINALIFLVILLIFFITKLITPAEQAIPDNDGILFLPMEFGSINEILSQPYEEVESVSTKYSVLYKNGIERKMYVFALPVKEMQNRKYVLLDAQIYENGDGTFGTKNKNFNVRFNNDSVDLQHINLKIAILFDKMDLIKESDYLNIYGETKEAVKYSGTADNLEMRCIPTYNGVLMELDLPNKIEKSEITFELDMAKRQLLKYKNDPAGYVKILDEDEDNIGVFHQGIVVGGDNRFYANNKVKIAVKNKRYYLTVDLSKLPADVSYPAKLAMNFDFYREKMFYDTSVYEAMPNVNTMLNNVSIFDSINEGNSGYTYFKYNVRSFTPKESKLIDSFSCSFYVMSVTGNADIEVYRVPKDWCSSMINWNDKPNHAEKLGEFTVSEKGWYKIDLTEYVKKLIDRDYDKLNDNSIVLKMKDGSRGYLVLASVDNTYAPPFFEVNYMVQEHAANPE